MAAVDLYGGDAGRIRSQYQTSLGRDASDDEVTGWLSGGYGGGGLDQWLQQIESSHEAATRRSQSNRPVGETPPEVSGTMPVSSPSQGSAPNYQNLDWWGQQGVPSSQIFNNSTGQ